MQPDNHADARGAEDDWAERGCLAWEAGVEVLCGLAARGSRWAYLRVKRNQ